MCGVGCLGPCHRATPQLLPSGVIGCCWFHKATTLLDGGDGDGVEFRARRAVSGRMIWLTKGARRYVPCARSAQWGRSGSDMFRAARNRRLRRAYRRTIGRVDNSDNGDWHSEVGSDFKVGRGERDAGRIWRRGRFAGTLESQAGPPIAGRTDGDGDIKWRCHRSTIIATGWRKRSIEGWGGMD